MVDLSLGPEGCGGRDAVELIWNLVKMFETCVRFGISNGGTGGDFCLSGCDWGLFLSGCDWSPGFRIPFGIGVINAGFGSDSGGGSGGDHGVIVDVVL